MSITESQEDEASKVIATLVKTARRAGWHAVYDGALHPEDIGYAMSNAVEHGAVALGVYYETQPADPLPEQVA